MKEGMAAMLAGPARADHEGGDRRRRPTPRPKITALVPQRRGQILGYDARPGWPGWDVVEATMPQSEIGDLIIELRSATAGVASYRATFDHMAELTGRLADEVMNDKRQGRLGKNTRPAVTSAARHAKVMRGELISPARHMTLPQPFAKE